MRSDPVAINILEELFHGRIRFANIIAERIARSAGWAMHDYLAAAAIYMQRLCANRTGMSGRDVPRREITHMASIARYCA